MRILIKTAVLLSISFLLCACALQKPMAESKVSSSQDLDTLKEQMLEDVQKMRISADYALQPGDLLEIKVFMEEGMDRVLRISGNGNITFPLVGNLKVANLSLTQAEDKLASSLKTYLKNPQVSILIKEYGNKTVYILGQVKKPSSIDIPPEKKLTVLEAITSAGGFTDIAASSRVRVLRMEGDKQKTFDVDVTQITKQGNKALDIDLMPGDVVYVPQSMF